MEVGPAHKDFAAFRHNGRVVAAGTDAARRLAILQLPEDGPRQESVPLRPNSDLTIFVLAKGPHEGFPVDDLLRDHPDVVCIAILLLFGTLALPCAVRLRPVVGVETRAEAGFGRIAFDLVCGLIVRVWHGKTHMFDVACGSLRLLSVILVRLVAVTTV